MSGFQTPAWLNHSIAYNFAVSDEERKRYTASIDAILATADLETISRKKIRQGLEAAEGRDLDDQKVRLSLNFRWLPFGAAHLVRPANSPRLPSSG